MERNKDRYFLRCTGQYCSGSRSSIEINEELYDWLHEHCASFDLVRRRGEPDRVVWSFKMDK